MDLESSVNGKRKLSIREIRKKLSMSQKEFADAIGVRRMTVSDWERGTQYPSSIETAVKLWRLLREADLTPDDIALPEQEQ